MRNLMKKYLNFTLFYFAAFFSFYETVRLTKKIVPLIKIKLDYLSIIPFPALKIFQITTGVCFVFIGFSFMSKGFKKTFPFLMFEKDFFEQTNSWLIRGILFGFFSAIGYYLLGLINWPWSCLFLINLSTTSPSAKYGPTSPVPTHRWVTNDRTTWLPSQHLHPNSKTRVYPCNIKWIWRFKWQLKDKHYDVPAAIAWSPGYAADWLNFSGWVPSGSALRSSSPWSLAASPASSYILPWYSSSQANKRTVEVSKTAEASLVLAVFDSPCPHRKSSDRNRHLQKIK